MVRTRAEVTFSLVVVVLAGVAAVELYNRAFLGGWSPLAAPQRVDFCGARYYRTGDARSPFDPPVTKSRAQALRIDQSLAQLQKIDRPTQWLHSATVGLGRWQLYRTSAWSCPEPEEDLAGHFLYVKTGPDRYMQMTDAH